MEKSIPEIISDFTLTAERLSRNTDYLLKKINEKNDQIQLLEERLSARSEQLARAETAFFSEQKKQIDKIRQEPLTTRLNDEDRGAIAKLESKFKLMKYAFIGLLSATGLNILSLAVVGSLAAKFYGNSVKSKTEIREEIFAEMKKEGKGFYDIDHVEKNERDINIVNSWMKKNKDCGEKMMQFREGKISK